MITKLIIVYNKDTQKYANYMLQLISLKDDEDGNVIGSQDGSVEAAVWSEKEYEDKMRCLQPQER